MTHEMKQLAFGLLRGDCYLSTRHDTKGIKRFMLYKNNQEPLMYISDTAYNKYKCLYKKDRNNRITLNLSLVRQAHGKSYIKSLYNKLKTTI